MKHFGKNPFKWRWKWKVTKGEKLGAAIMVVGLTGLGIGWALDNPTVSIIGLLIVAVFIGGATIALMTD